MSKIFKLNTISILPEDISVTESMIISHLLPLFKLEIWLSGILLDETHQIFVSKFKENNNLFLQIKTKPFRYFPKQLFNRSKVARLQIKLLRGNKNWTESEEVQVFNIVLSEYSYEYCRSRYNEFREHSVGTSKKTFLYYRVQCEYQPQQLQISSEGLLPLQQRCEVKPLFKQFQQIKDRTNLDVSEMKKSRNNSKMLGQFLPNTLFPLQDKQNIHSAQSSRVFIQLQAMRPVYRHQSAQNRKLRIKIDSSYLIADQTNSQQNSVVNENNKLVKQTSNFLNALYYIFVVLCIGIAIIQMSPSKKA